MPEPVSNNAVAQVSTEQGDYLISFMGLGANKDHNAVHNKVWQWRVGEPNWQSGPAVPSVLPLKGRLAATAVGVGQEAFVFGGYTVAADHSEISAPDNFAYDPVSQRYRRLAEMPVPVDDSVALSYQQRYIYLVSGWHNDGNVNLVQRYDTQTDQWAQATPFPGPAVFGQGGAIWQDTLVVCDGVKVVVPNADEARLADTPRRQFLPSPECFVGRIDADNGLKIHWQQLAHPSGVALYRRAAAAHNGQLWFVGGSNNPYNYDGIGYDGKPSAPSRRIDRYDIATGQWLSGEGVQAPTMDHRGLLWLDNGAVLLGGMGEDQRVLSEVSLLPLGQ